MNIDFTQNYLVQNESGELFVALAVPGDGNCFFHCIAHFVGEDHNIIRQKCIDYIIAKKNIFANFMQDDQKIENYIENMSKTGSWAGHIEIACVSILYNLKVDLYTVDNTLENISKIRYSIVGEGQKSIMLMYLPRLHYWPLIKIEPEPEYNDISLVEEVRSEKRKLSENIEDESDKKCPRRVNKIDNETFDEQERRLKKQRESRVYHVWWY